VHRAKGYQCRFVQLSHYQSLPRLIIAIDEDCPFAITKKLQPMNV
jgi:hypothetical protein